MTTVVILGKISEIELNPAFLFLSPPPPPPHLFHDCRQSCNQTHVSVFLTLKQGG